MEMLMLPLVILFNAESTMLELLVNQPPMLILTVHMLDQLEQEYVEVSVQPPLVLSLLEALLHQPLLPLEFL